METKRTPVEKVVIDSKMTFEEAIKGSKAPKRIINTLALVSVQYYDFNETLREGQLLIYKRLVADVIALFKKIKKKKFPIKSVIPIVRFQWDDVKSMENNNTSAFNYRPIRGLRKLSDHSYGIALDINPYQNPYLSKTTVLPANAVYRPERKGTITKQSFIYKFLKKRGWTWGGNWRIVKDYHHFEKK